MVTIDKRKWLDEKNLISTVFDIVPLRTRIISVNASYDIIEEGNVIRQVRDIDLVEEQWKNKDRRIYIVGGGKVLDKFGTFRSFKYEKVDANDCPTISEEIIKVIKYIKDYDQTI